MHHLQLIVLSLILCTSCDFKKENDYHVKSTQFFIAYNVNVDQENDDYDVWVIDPSTRLKKNVTNHSDVAWTYLACDDKIYFVSDRDTSKRAYFLYEMNTNGEELNQIGNIRLKDSWMGVRNNCTEFIVNPHASVDSVFHIINSEGELIRRVDPGLPSFSDPAFSPDGTVIAFRGGTTPSKRNSDHKESIYLLNEDGKELRSIFTYPESDTTAKWYAYHAGVPRWHPSGEFISFQSFQNGKYSLYAASTKGDKQWKLLNTNHEEGWHDWSPDGNWLAIELFDDVQSQFHIGLMSWPEQELTILTDTIYRLQQAPVIVKK